MTRTICSISYRHLKARRQYRYRDTEGGFGTNFEILPAPRDGYSLLAVRDMEERYKFSSQAPDTVMHKETTGEKVAACLIQEWSGNLAVGGLMGDSVPGKPGIFICMELDEKDASGKVIKPATKPGPEELRVARESQTVWCQSLCAEADSYSRSPRDRGKIRLDVHAAAADWLGEVYPWMKPRPQKFTDECPVCGGDVKHGTLKCPHAGCGEIIDRAGYEAWQAEETKSATLRAKVRAAQEEHAGLVGAKK